MRFFERLKLRWRLWRNAKFNNYLRIYNTEKDPMENGEEFTTAHNKEGE